MNTTTATAEITISRKNRHFARELLLASHAKHGTGVTEHKGLRHSVFTVTGTPQALRVLARAFKGVA